MWLGCMKIWKMLKKLVSSKNIIGVVNTMQILIVMFLMNYHMKSQIVMSKGSSRIMKWPSLTITHERWM